MPSASSLTALQRWPPAAGGGRKKRAAAGRAEALRIGDGVVWISEFGEGGELEQNKKSRTSGGTEWGELGARTDMRRGESLRKDTGTVASGLTGRGPRLPSV